ncbi:integrin alpha-PS1-like [Tachypleus tridentatus]|uniref:integrin alpha-PS1-like n=1 Tax=Tachypleus tridentatus TaxID=6853 RepID=UPI003FD13287
METNSRFWTFIVLYLLQIQLPVKSFNLETRLPLIKQGDRGSYFGFSVAEHLAVYGEDSKFYPVLLVGAPLAQTSQPGTNRSGALYQCELNTFRKDCRQVDVESDVLEPADDVDKDGQWLGVSVTSQKPGGYVMTCAHRYVLKGSDFRWGEGVCYSLTPALDRHREWDPCLNRARNKAHEQYGYCQAGVSVYITEDNNLVIGTPGPYTWKGTVFVNNVRFGILDDQLWYKGPLMDINLPPVKKYSYLGMSVTGGKFFGSHTSFVGGAPRSNGTGQVVFFKKDETKQNEHFVVELILDGEIFLSSFGYSVTCLDINGDGALDLAVGAPFYFSKKDGGAVYVYLNTGTGFQKTNIPTKLTGKLESAFGMALSTAGDLNKDGYYDLAIGAPYEENGRGAVYIHLGSAEGLTIKAVQVIRPSDFPRKALFRTRLTTFGYSLSGGLDMDSNSYPDLLVGAYESDAVVLLRSRPVIGVTTTVKGNFTHIDPQKKGCPEDPSNPRVCFSLEACFEITDSRLSFGTDLKIRYKIEAETFKRKYYRVIFGSSDDSDSPNVVTADLRVAVGIPTCQKEMVYLKDETDIQSPIQFKLTYSLVQKDPRMPQEGEKLPDVNNYPILNQQEATKTFEATFLKDCGDDEICQSELTLEAIFELPQLTSVKDEKKLYVGEGHFNVSVRVLNKGEPAYDAAFYISHPSSTSYVNHFTKDNLVNVECKPVTENSLKCTLGNPFNLKEVEVKIKFDPRKVEEEEGESLQFEFSVNTTSVNLAKDLKLTKEVDIVRLAELELNGGAQPEQVLYGGDVIGETSMKYDRDIGSSVTHTYQVHNYGPYRAKQVKVIISWPYEVENKRAHGKWLLYMVETPKVEGNGYCEMQEGQVNPLKLLTSRDGNSEFVDDGVVTVNGRTKREVIILPEEKRVDGKMVKFVTLDCQRGSAKCFRFTCIINNLNSRKSDIIRIKARLWNSTFVEDYPNVDYVSIISRGVIYLDPTLDIEQNTTNDKAMAETKAYPDKLVSEAEKGVPIWIIIVSVACGVLLLIIVILILWKCGFFARPLRRYGVVPNEEKDSNNYPHAS